MTTIKKGLRIAVLPLWLAISMTTAHGQQAKVTENTVAVNTVAAQPGPVHAVLSAHIVRTKDSKELLSDDSRKALPGDVIEYRVIYRNTGKQAVASVEAMLPLPEGATYQSGSARPNVFMARIGKQKEFFPTPIKRQVMEEGQPKEVDIPSSEYRELRWNLGELTAGESKTVSARIVVPGNVASALPAKPVP